MKGIVLSGLLAASSGAPQAAKVFDGEARPVQMAALTEIPPSVIVEMGLEKRDRIELKDGGWFRERYKETAALYPDSDLKTERVMKPLARCSGFLSCLGKGLVSPVVTPVKMSVYNTIDRVFDSEVYPSSRGPFNPYPLLAPFTGFISGAVVGAVGAVLCVGKAFGKLVRGKWL